MCFISSTTRQKHYCESSDCFEYPKITQLKSNHPQKSQMFLPIKSLKFEIPQNFIQSSLSLENQSTCSSPWGQVSVVTIIKPKKETGQVHAIVIPLDKTGMVQSMLFAEPSNDIFLFVKSSYALVSGNTNKSLQVTQGSKE